MAQPMDADTDESYAHFLQRIIASRTAWVLVEPRTKGAAAVASHDHERDGEPVPVQLLFSARAAAQNLAIDDWDTYVPASVGLEALINGVLPEMERAGLLVGPDYLTDLTGVEVQPGELRAALEKATGVAPRARRAAAKRKP
jgi:hypothetical protein